MQIAHVKNSRRSQNILLTDAWIVTGGNGNNMGGYESPVESRMENYYNSRCLLLQNPGQ